MIFLICKHLLMFTYKFAKCINSCNTNTNYKHNAIKMFIWCHTPSWYQDKEAGLCRYKTLTLCTVNEFQIVESHSTTHISRSNRFKYQNKVPQFSQRHFCSPPFLIHLLLCPHLPQLVLCLLVTHKEKMKISIWRFSSGCCLVKRYWQKHW